MTTLYFFTIHDEDGSRIDDDSDHPMTEAQLDAALKDFDPILIGGDRFWANPQADGSRLIVNYVGMEIEA